MENKSENTETTVVNAVIDEAVEKTDTAKVSAEEVVEKNSPIESVVEETIEVVKEEVTVIPEVVSTVEETTNQAIVVVPTQTEENSCDKTECDPCIRLGIIIGVAVLILIILSFVIKSKKKKTTTKGKKKSFKSNPNAVEIYVGNLSYEMGNSELRKEFEKFGIVTSARIITQRNSRKSKGYGFVEMPHRSEAEEAIRALNNKEIKGRKIHVNEARANTRHGSN